MLLRLFQLGSKSLWLDESYSVLIAQGPIWEVVVPKFAYYHPPLYVLLLHFWQFIGPSEFLLRFPSLLLGVLSVALLFSLAKDLFGTRVALVAALLLAISPLHIWYSQEARGYILVTFLGLTSIYLFSKVLTKGGVGYWGAYILVMLLGLYADYGMLLLVLLQNLFVVVFLLRFKGKRLAIPWVIGQFLVLLGFSPWLPRLLTQVDGAISGYSSVIRIQQFLNGFGVDVGATTLLIILVASLVTVLTLLATAGRGMWRYLRNLWEVPSLIFSLLLGLYVLANLLSSLPYGGSIKRQLLILFPYFLLAISIGASRLRFAETKFMVLAVLIAVPALGANYFVNEKEQWRAVAQLVDAEGREGDIILLHAGYTAVPFDYYYSGNLPRQAAPSEDQLMQTATRHKRVWLVLSNDRYVDPEGKVQRWFDRCYDSRLSSSYAYITVRLYDVAGKGCAVLAPPEAN